MQDDLETFEAKRVSVEDKWSWTTKVRLNLIFIRHVGTTCVIKVCFQVRLLPVPKEKCGWSRTNCGWPPLAL